MSTKERMVAPIMPFTPANMSCQMMKASKSGWTVSILYPLSRVLLILTLTPVRYHSLRLTLDNKLWLAPIENPSAVLDVGTGTGVWAMDCADEYPGAEVIGVDLSPIQPLHVPPICNSRYAT